MLLRRILIIVGALMLLAVPTTMWFVPESPYDGGHPFPIVFTYILLIQLIGGVALLGIGLYKEIDAR